MLPILEEPTLRARVPPLSVASYHQLCAAEALPEAVELLGGVIVEKLAKSPLHSSIVTRLFKQLVLSLPDGFLVRSEQPLTLQDSEPEPDLAVVFAEKSEYTDAHPTTAAMVIEVAVSSERIDRIKLGIYAEAAVAECWLVLVEEQIVERHTMPTDVGYTKVERCSGSTFLASTVLQEFTISLAQLFPTIRES